MNNIPLNQAKGISYTSQDLYNALTKCNISKGDTVCIHTDLSEFGSPLIKNKFEYLQVIVDVIQECVGQEGTIVMPTFTYSFCKNEVYDVDNTPSKMGILTEYFRKISDVKRTLDPIFSFAVWGKKQKYYLEIGNDCFGKDSIYDKLYHDNAKLILLGSEFKGYTFFHYIEEAVTIPYRFIKRFEGSVLSGENSYHLAFDYYVRYLDKPSVPDIPKIVKFLIDTDNFTKTTFGFGNVVGIDMKQFFAQASEILKNDSYYFI